MSVYFRPVVQTDATRPPDARPVAGGWGWFTHAERIERGGQRKLVAALDMPADALDRICAPRAEFAGLSMDRPAPDGRPEHHARQFFGRRAHRRSRRGRWTGRGPWLLAGPTFWMSAANPPARAPEKFPWPRNARGWCRLSKPFATLGRRCRSTHANRVFAAAAIEVGARIVNDVSALGFDPDMGGVVAQSGAPVILMHAQGAPATMQDNPRYGDVLLDVYDGLAGAISARRGCRDRAQPYRNRPGIGFGKTQDHNLTLLRGISIFHDLGCPIVLGASRKRFIGTLTGVERADQRVTGSVAVTQAAIMQGVQIHRVHDIDAMLQALDMVAALTVQRGWHPDQKAAKCHDAQDIWNRRQFAAAPIRTP